MQVNCKNQSSQRRGAVAIAALVAVPVLILAFVLLVNASLLVKANFQAQRGVDSAALAAIQTLVNDDALESRSDVHRRLLDRACVQAQLCLRPNPTLGRVADLRVTTLPDDDDCDVVFGRLPIAGGQATRVAGLIACDDDLDEIDAVTVHARYTRARHQPIRLICYGGLGGSLVDLTCSATAYLDWNVCGFRQVFDCQPIPLVPLALLSCEPEDDAYLCSWNCQVEDDEDEEDDDDDDDDEDEDEEDDDDDDEQDDDCRLPRMRVRLCRSEADDSDEVAPNACLLWLGRRDWKTVERQFCQGITKEDLDRHLGGRLVLPAGRALAVAGTMPGEPLARSQRKLLARCCRHIQLSKQPRIFPLYTSVHSESGSVGITRFVAARIIEVEDDEEGGIRLLLQPARMSTVTAITCRPAKRSPPASNRYICKVKLVN